MISTRAAVPLIVISCAWTAGAQVPEKALRYHAALLQRPHNAALFDRFFGAWIDEQPVETLGDFLTVEAKEKGGANWVVLATYELRRGKEDAALDAMGQGMAALPADAALPMERGKLRLRRLEFPGAREDFAIAAAAATGDEALALDAAKLTGKAWLREGKTAEAIAVWDALLAAHPGDEELLEDLVESAAAESEIAQALVYAEKLVAASRDPYQKTLRQLRRADLLARAGRDDDAVDACAATLAQVGDGSWLEREVLAQIDKIFRRQERVADLAAKLKSLAGIYPQRLALQRQLAKLEAAQGDTDAAIGRFREVLKRSPGERELREEFVRLLTDSERFDDAATELSSLIELTPADANLQLQLAALRARQGKPDAVATALEKARTLLGNDEPAGLRIASLLLQYGLTPQGEALLNQLANAPSASSAALEALAAQYARSGRKDEAIGLLKKASAAGDPDALLRVAGSISAMGEAGVAYETLSARAAEFSGEPRFLAAQSQAALAAGKSAEAVPPALKLLRMAKQSGELAEAIPLVTRAATAAEKSTELRESLAAQPTRTPAETCLLATLTQDAGDMDAVSILLESATDPLLVRFHAALLDRRGDLTAAIAVLTRLADTPEGQKAAYFKELAELQQRAGQIPAALATVDRWKLAAPGDKSAWLTGSRLQRESGKPELAVQTLRQAVGRFEGDADLAAQLAALHHEAGQWIDAETIYWQLHDDATSPSDQARWAAQLAQLAQRTGTTAALEEKLRERARNNRRAVGPLLALAELARVTTNEDKRRDFLLEAVRLQPKDLDLRLQIANLEEQSGNAERVLAVLEEALPYDTNNRVRSALAQAYLSQGQAVKGMRELRLLSGKTGFDARSAESAAAALATTKLYDEAILLLRTELRDGGDWRSRYLLAILLEEDGREAEAQPMFLELLQATGEIAALLPKVPVPPAPVRAYVDLTPESVKNLQRLVAANQMAYAHRATRSGYSYGRTGSSAATAVAGFYLPNTPEDVRQFALVHLCRLSKSAMGESDGPLRDRIRSAGIGNVDFLVELLSPSLEGGRMDFGKLLETYPNEPGVFEWLMGNSYYGNQQVDTKTLRKYLDHAENLSPLPRFNAWLLLAQSSPPDDPAWAATLAAARECVEGKSPELAGSIASRMMYLLHGQGGACPDIHTAGVKKLMLDGMARMVAAHPEAAHGGNILAMVAIAGSPDRWIEEINATIRESRKKPLGKTGQRMTRTRFSQVMQYSSRSYGSYNPWSSVGDLFELPNLETLAARSIPAEVLIQFSDRLENGNPHAKMPLTVAELVKRSEDLESPYLRAWLAAKAGDSAALVKAMAAEVPAEEAYDFEVLRAVLALQEKKPEVAFAALQRARLAAGAEREFAGWVNTVIISAAGAMTPEQRTAIAPDLQATFLQLRPAFGTQGAVLLAAQARKLGLEDLAKRIEPAGTLPGTRGGGSATGPAAIASPASQGSGSPVGQAGGSPEKVRKFVTEKKFEAAAREVLQGIRSQKPNGSSYYFRSQLPELIGILGKDGQAELIKLVDPGDSKSLIRRLEFVDICKLADKPQLALATLEELGKERPDDGGIAARLAFEIPADEIDRRLELMTKACVTEEFFNQASAIGRKLNEQNDTKEAYQFFEPVTRWLEVTDPKVTAEANLTWVSYFSKQFLGGGMTSSIPSVFSEEKADKSENVSEIQRHTTLCKRLATAMMRHATTSEEGFRLLAAGKVWKLDLAEMDANARAALLGAASLSKTPQWQRSQSYSYFSLISNGGSSSSGENLDQHSSAAWLMKRLKEAKSPGEIFSADYLVQLRAANPIVGKFVTDLLGDLTSAQLGKLWESELMQSSNGRLARMLRPLLIKRAAVTGGATKFFTDQILAIPAGSVVSTNGSTVDGEGRQALFAAAVVSAADGKPAELAGVAKAISRAVYGDALASTNAHEQQSAYQRVNFLASVLQQIGEDPLVMARYQAAFFKLGVPVDDDEYGACRPFQNKRFSKVEDAIAFLESTGWICSADRWQPYACYLLDTQSMGSGRPLNVQPKLLLEQAMEYMRYGGIAEGELVKKLQERKDGRFGALMLAAAISSGKERSDLVATAFSESSAVLAKMPPDRVEALALVLPWLDKNARAKLPESFRRKAKEVESKLRDEIVRQADSYLASISTNRSDNDLSQSSQLAMTLMPYDVDKAVEVFVAGEKSYTEWLARGGRFSNSSSGDWQYSQRDSVFGDINEATEVFASSPDLRLRFFAKILASPAGKRLVFNDSSYSERSIFPRAAESFFGTADQHNEKAESHILKCVGSFLTVDPTLKSTALPCFLLTRYDGRPIENVEQRKALVTQLAKLVQKDPQAARLGTALAALRSWRFCTPEEKSKARETFADLISDPAIADVQRLVMAADFITKIPKDELLVGPFPAALGTLYQGYCAGERSAVNLVSSWMFDALLKSPVREESLAPTYAALARNFWENAMATKPAGHPPIPPALARSVFMASLLGNDTVAVAKDFQRIKPALSGKLSSVVFLLEAGQHDLAKQLAPLPDDPFDTEEGNFTYTRATEQALEGYRRVAPDPAALQKLEIEMLAFDTGKNADAPTESLAQRNERLINSVVATPPQGRQFPIALSSLFSHSPGNEKLMRLLLPWAKLNPADGFFQDSRGSRNSSQERSRRAAIKLQGIAAMHSYAAGDASALESLRDWADIPASNRNNRTYYLSRDYGDMLRQMAMTLAGEVAAGRTAKFGENLATWNELVVRVVGLSTRGDSSAISVALPMSHFLAALAGDMPAYNEMMGRLPKGADSYAKRSKPGEVIVPFSDLLGGSSSETALPPAERQAFLAGVIAVPALAPAFPREVGWIAKLRDRGYSEAIDALALDPPAGALNEALVVFNERAGELKREKNDLEGAAAEFRAGLDRCPPGDEWKASRGVMKWKLADVLLTSEEPAKAKEIFATIAPDEIADWLKDRYRDLAKKLGVKDETK